MIKVQETNNPTLKPFSHIIQPWKQRRIWPSQATLNLRLTYEVFSHPKWNYLWLSYLYALSTIMALLDLYKCRDINIELR